MLAIAGQHLTAADLVFARIENGASKLDCLPPDMLTAGDRNRLAGTLVFLDRAPLLIEGSAFEIEQGRSASTRSGHCSPRQLVTFTSAF